MYRSVLNTKPKKKEPEKRKKSFVKVFTDQNLVLLNLVGIHFRFTLFSFTYSFYYTIQ